MFRKIIQDIAISSNILLISRWVWWIKLCEKNYSFAGFETFIR